MCSDLVQMVREGTIEDVKVALAANPDVNRIDDDGCTALYYAAKAGDVAMTNALLRAGALPASGRFGRSALRIAIEVDHSTIVEAILDAGYAADIVQTEGDPTPLMKAALHNRIGIMRLLLKRGADPNYQSSDRLRPIDYASGKPNLEAFELLFPLTDWWYRKTAKRNLEQRQQINAQRAARNTPEKKAQRRLRLEAALEKYREEGSILDRLASGEPIELPMPPEQLDD
ncbi:MAG: ankyrin repeat domain-containing protein [Pirellulales bacterium]